MIDITKIVAAVETAEVLPTRTRIAGTITPYAIATMINETLVALGRSELIIKTQPIYGPARAGLITGKKWETGDQITEEQAEKFAARYVATLIKKNPKKVVPTTPVVETKTTK